MYRLQFDNQHVINFIYDGTEILIKTDYNNILNTIEIRKSESNKLFYQFLKLNKEYKTKTDLLNLILTRFPKDDEYYETTQNRLDEIYKMSI